MLFAPAARYWPTCMTVCFCGLYSLVTSTPLLPGRVRSTVTCLHLCLFACLLEHLKNGMSKRHQIFYTCYLWPRLGPLLFSRRCNTSGLADDVIFSHNGPNHGAKFRYRPLANYSSRLARWRLGRSLPLPCWLMRRSLYVEI